ncbi:Phosphatidylglycerol/phosphatidylinositol transfer protein [Escovopsis weberi]|uniref:Phosphatidylglycerol/phosphatidylinositol transfer protein n=1 Tax=Escovopsis weberi TaxID=150374 RepID=A0A0N0RT42_ESCWE|nr:Phosphatidylglycerol/phosphatidylinositol transfer protein [Escovopsis weberi]
MRFTSSLLCLAACLTAPAAAASIFTPSVFPGEDHKIPGKSPMYLCDGDHQEDILHITEVDIAPNPPKAGQDLVITASGFTSKDIDEGAYAKVTVKLGLIKLISQTFDLCEQVGQIDLKCPIEKGNMTITKTVSLPREIPPAKFNVVADVYSADDEPVTCLTANVDFMLRRGSLMYEDNEEL